MKQFFYTFAGNLSGLFLLVTILLITAELTARFLFIGRFEPNIKHCPPRQIPRLIWKVLTYNRLHIFSLLTSRTRTRKHKETPSIEDK